MLGNGNYIEFEDTVINIDFITHIKKIHQTDFDGGIITWWRVYTRESTYIDLNQEEYEFLTSTVLRLSNSYTKY